MTIQTNGRAVRALLAVRARSTSAARVSLMLGTALGCSIAIVAGAPGAAFAQACGPVVGGEVTCTATSGVGNPYPTGIYYAGAAGEDITVVVGDPMAEVVINSGGNYGVFVDAANGQTGTIIIEDNVTITTVSSGARANGGVADTVVTNDGDVTAGIRGIWAFSTGDTTAENSGDIFVDGASNSFFIAIGVQASSYGANVAYASNTGTIEITGAANDIVRGINSSSQSGNAYAYNAGVIDISAVGAAGMVGIGVFAGVHGEVTTTADGAIVVNTPGTGYAYGIFVRSYTGDAVVEAAGDITVTTLGYATGIGVRAQTSVDITAGDITVTGGAGTGIWANAGGALTITANGDITATGNDIEGIAAYSNTGIVITATGDISTAGANAEGIRARGYAEANVNLSAGDITTTGVNSEGIYAVGNMNIDVSSTGLISTAGDNSYGVLARSFGAGGVYVSVTDVETTGANSEGVWAFANTDVTVIALGDVTTAGNDSVGLYGGSYGAGLVNIAAATVSTAGYDSTAIFANSNNGLVEVTFDSLVTTGAGSDGVVASAGTGISVIGGDIDATGYGVYAQTTTGDIYVSVGDVDANVRGVTAQADAGYVTIETGALSVASYGTTYGVFAAAATGVSVSVAGDISVSTGEGSATGVYAQTDGGLASIVVVGDTVVSASGNAYGIEEHGAEEGAVVDVTGSISATSTGAYAYGVYATATYGLIDIDVTGAITADGYDGATGILAVFDASAPPPPPPPPSQGEGPVTAALGDPQTIDITVGGLITATSSNGTAAGVYASAADGVTANLGDVSATAAGAAYAVEIISAEGDVVLSVGDITATSYGTGPGALDRAIGFEITAEYGSADVTIVGDITAYGEGNAGAGGGGVLAGDDASIDLTGNLVVTATQSNAFGLAAQSYDGSATISVTGDTSVEAYGSATGLQTYAYGTAGIDVVGDVAATAQVALGVSANSTDGSASVTVLGDINIDTYAFGTGVRAEGFTGATVEVTGNVTVAADSVEIDIAPVSGIIAMSDYGIAAVTVTGDIDVSGYTVNAMGVSAAGYDGAAVTLTGALMVASVEDIARGIDAYSVFGDATITVTGNVGVYSDYDLAIGLDATSAEGDASIDATGNVTVAGNYAVGASADSYYGDASVDVTGDVSVVAAGLATGLSASTYGLGAASVTVTGDLDVSSDRAAAGALVYSYDGLASATITGDVTVAATDYATGVSATGESAAIDINGDISVTGGEGEATGVQAYAQSSLASVIIVGDTVVNAAGDAIGVYGFSYDGGVSVDVTGSISATSSGARAYGVVGYAYYGDVTIEVSGAITADAATDAFGVLVSFGEPEPYYYYYYYGRQTVVSGDVTAALGDPQTVEVTVGGLITVHSDYGFAAGVQVTADDAITVETADITATADAGSAFGLDLDSNYGDISVTVDGDLSISAPGGSSSAFGMDLSAGGAIDVVMTGDIDAQGGWAAYGVLAQGHDNVSVDIDGAITADAQGNATGARADSQYGSAYAYVVDVDVFAYGTAVGVTVVGETGATAVSTGQVTSSGVGVSARSNLGAATATVVDVTAGSDAVWAITNNGDATVIATGEIISGGAGLSAWAGSGDANVTNDGSVTTSGSYAYGIRATTSSGDVNVDSDGTVETNGDAAYGILARTDAGDIAISFADVSTFGSALLTGSYTGEGGEIYYDYGQASHGIVATSGEGTVTIEGGDVFTGGDGAEGIIASGYGAVLVDVGTVQTQGGLLRSSTSEDGDVFDTSTGAIGIDAMVHGGDLSIYADAVYTAGDFATGIVAIGAAINVYDYSGYDARPIGSLITLSGDVLVDVGIVQTLGDNANGIEAFNAGGEVVVLAEGVYTFGDQSTGIYAIAVAASDAVSGGLLIGDASVAADTVHTYGEASTGIFASSTGGDASVDAVDVLTFGEDSTGIVVSASGAYDYALETFVFGDAIVVADNVTTHGDGAVAVNAYAQFGDVSILAGDVYTGGDDADGLWGHASGDVAIEADNVVAMGDYSTGIRGVSANGDVAVLAENVMVYGYGADAIVVIANNGEDGSQDTDVTVTGIVSSFTGSGIVADAGGYSSITIDHGLVTGAYAGIVSTSGYATLIDNDGGFIYGGSGLAIQVDGGFAQIDNGGFIGGRVDLTDNADSFDNSGVFEAYGTSSFGLGADVFSNTGTVGFSRSNGAASTTTFTGLESFNNTGLVSGVDSQAGDVLSMADTTFNGGTNSRLGLDVQFGGPGSIADRIVIGQATGVTTIVPNSVLAATPGVLNFAGILVVDSAFATETGAEFTMAPVDTGFVEYSLRFDAPTDNWLIIGLPDTSVFRILALPGAMQDFWQRSSVAVNSRWQESRDADGTPGLSAGPDGATGRSEGAEMWMQAHGGDEGFEDFETFTVGGSVFVENQSHNSDWRGFQFGADNRTGDFTWGLTGGFVQQETTFEVGGESFDIEGWNVGAYASWMSGGLFLNGLAKGDFNTVDANLTAVGDMETFDASSFGLQGELGYRLAGDAWFVEPVASLSWTQTRIDSFTASGATLDFEDADSLVGKAGMRVGWTVGSGDVVLVPAIGVFAIDEFEGENAMTFTTGATSFAVTDTPPGAYGKVEFGVTAQTFYGLEGYVRGEVNFGDEAEGGAVRLGARWRW